MEKAILKTLIYANIFDYPLKGYEVYKWLIGEETTLIKVEKALKRLSKKLKVKSKNGYFFLKRRENLVSKRKRRYKYSRKFLIKTKLLIQVLKIIPWIKLVGISGGLAVDNSEKKDDIDLFLITDKNRLWLSRILAIFIFDLMGIRRKVGMKPKQTASKFCLNTILDEDHLEQRFKDLYTAHEVLQMKLLWQREGIYSKYLADNNWAFEFLPNWTSRIKYIKIKKDQGLKIIDLAEILAKWLQLKLMKKRIGQERIEDGGLYFHPGDYREKVLKEFNKRSLRLRLKKIKKLSTS